MYSRQTADSRRSRNLSIPVNYSGNAFREDTADDPSETVTESESSCDPKAVAEPSQAVAIVEREHHEGGTGPFRLFGSSSGGIGLEELLILGLVFLISQNDAKDDLSFLLLLLLFIK